MGGLGPCRRILFCGIPSTPWSQAITKQQLMQTFHLNAAGFGTLSAFFTLSYVAMQIPVGTLVDKYGAHKLLVLNALHVPLGVLFCKRYCFVVCANRPIIVGYRCRICICGHYALSYAMVSPHKIGLIAGMTQAAGMLGATVGEGPFALIVESMGWRQTMWLIGGIILALAILILLVVRDKPTHTSDSLTDDRNSPRLTECLITVLRNPQSWYNGLFVGLLYAPTAAFAELWGFLFQRPYHISNTIAASGISAIFLGWTIGGPLAGWFSDQQKKRKPIMRASARCQFVHYVSHNLHTPPPYMSYTLFFLYGLANTGVATSYALSSEINPVRVSGTSIAFANMSSVIIGSALQPVIGKILDTMWQGTVSHGAPTYSVEAYQHALFVLPLCYF